MICLIYLGNKVNKKCKICGSENVENVKIGSTALIKCKDCGVHYLADFGTAEQIDDYYKKDYKITSADIQETEFRRIFRITEQVELVSEVMNYVKPPANLLDIGCDKGFFIDTARRFGYECTGIELSETAREYASKIGLNVMTGIENSEQKFDVAVMWHVLEHFPEPKEYLSKLREHLSEDAYLFIRVPAFDTWSRKVFGKYWIWFQPENHLFHYTWQALEILLGNAGYSLESIEHRKPNNRNTKRMFKTTSILFNSLFNYKLNFRKYLTRKYEDWTGIELYAVAKVRRD